MPNDADSVDVPVRLLHDLRIVAGCLPADAVALFGSRVRGESRPESDLDVLVIGKDLPSVAVQAAFSGVQRCHEWHLSPRRAIQTLSISRAEIERQLREGSCFWRDVLSGPLLHLVGRADQILRDVEGAAEPTRERAR